MKIVVLSENFFRRIAENVKNVALPLCYFKIIVKLNVMTILGNKF